MKNDTGEMSMSEETKQDFGVEYYEMLLIVKFAWNPEHLSNGTNARRPTHQVTIDKVKKVICIAKMKSVKVIGPSGIVMEMIKAAGNIGAIMIRDFASAIACDGKIPTDWGQSFNVCLYRAR